MLSLSSLLHAADRARPTSRKDFHLREARRAQLSGDCSRAGVPMTDDLQVIAEMQIEVEEYRSLARELKAYKILARLDQLADDLARQALRVLALRHREGGVVAGSSPRKLH